MYATLARYFSEGLYIDSRRSHIYTASSSPPTYDTFFCTSLAAPSTLLFACSAKPSA